MAQWLLLLLLAVMISPKRDNAHDALCNSPGEIQPTGCIVAYSVPPGDIKQGVAVPAPRAAGTAGPADAACLSD